jgi:hypothetical protein
LKLRDNDTPGVYVTEIEPGSCAVSCVEDQHSFVIEGTNDPAVGGVYTGRADELLVQLMKAPEVGDVIRVKLVLDADSQQAMSLVDTTDALGRWNQWSDGSGGTYYTIDFTSLNWETPVIVSVKARDDADPEDPQTAVITFTQDTDASDADGGATVDLSGDYVFPNLRSGTGRTAVTVIDNETAGVVVVETGIGTLVVKCGDSACSIPGPTDSYYLRLTKRPEAENDPYHLQTPITVQIAILTDGLADVLAVNGVAVDYSSLSDPILQPIGDLVPSRVFQGNLDLADVAGKATLTRANGSDLGSFIDEGLEAGQLIRLSGTAFDGDYYVESVTHTAVTLATTFGGTDSVEGVTISRLTNVGHFEGSVTVEIDTTSTGCSVANPCRRFVRDESDPLIPSSWLADGFLEGQRVEIYDGTNYGRFKIAIIRGTNETKDNKIEFTPENGLLFFTANGWNDGNLLSITANRLAAMVTFDDGNATLNPNWYEEVEITLVADLNYQQPITRQGVKVFPVSTHVLSKLQGPLAVEGGVTGTDRSLQLGVKLPGEADGPLFAIGPQPPESKQIDVLNIFNDDSQQHLSGTMTSTTLQGLGLAKDLDFGPTYGSGNPQTFGEPAIFPGGISFGTVQFVDGKFQTNGGKSTIEVVNLMLGQGNDTFEVLGTLDPDVAVKLIGTVNIAAITPVPATFNAIVKLTRPQPFDWKSQGFLVGQPLHITGFSETFTVAGFGDDFTGDTIDNTIMYLT